MTWQDRLGEELVMMSPTGIEFIAYWKGGSRSMEKAVGIFKFPKIQGALVQDLDVGAVKYPLTFWFSGPNHDVISAAFFEACRERGKWVIYHPVRGSLWLQLISVSEDMEPVDSGNMTQITTEWIEPMDSKFTLSMSQIAAEIDEQIAEALDDGLNDFEDDIDDEEPGLLDQIRKTISDVVTKVHEVLDPISKTLSDVYAQCTAVYTSINSAIRSVTMSITSMGKLVQNLIMFPIEATNSTLHTIESCSGMIAKMVSFTPGSSSLRNKRTIKAGINTLAIQQLVMTASVCAMSRAIVSATDITNRDDALFFIDTLDEQFNLVVSTLDAGQALYASSPIGSRYFTMSKSYDSLTILMMLTKRLLLQRLFDLSVAKRFTLQTARCPVEIAITENVDLDMFIASNHLKGEEILLLPVGREVVVYL